MSIDDINDERLEKFLKDHDLHLLSDSTDIVTIGTIYRRFEDSRSRRIGYVSNFVTPPVSLPDANTGSMHSIKENFRDGKSINFIANGVLSFISSFGFSINTNNEKVVEVSYSNITLAEIDLVTFWNLLREHKMDTTSTEYDVTSEYYLVTRIVKSKDFRVNMKLTRDLNTVLRANGGNPIIDGDFKLEYAKGKFGEATLSYSGQEPLVFGAHLEKIEFEDTGAIKKLVPLTTVTKLLGGEKDNRVWI